MKKPSFVFFVLLRFIAVVLLLAGGIAYVVYRHRDSETLVWWMLGSLVVSAVVLVWLVYRWAFRVGEELRRIARYLETLEEETDAFDTQAHFFTREFDDINRHLLHVLSEAKKREEIKQRYNAKLKLKNRQRADMLSAIAHEFRNPVAAIMGYAQTLVDEPDLPEALRMKFLDKIYSNGEKIESLLSRLVLWNKFESGEATLHTSRFDFSELIEETAANLQEKYKDRTIRIETSGSCVVEADRTLMEVVLKNLIENALKYSDDEVRVRLRDGEVAVIDKGVGIAPEEIEKVTKKFYRSSVHSWDNSMGLGLSIVKTILKLHGTRLSIESTPSEGSTFAFHLPTKR